MARGSTWTNSDGLVVGFGAHTKDNDIPVVTSGGGSVKTMVMQIIGVDLPDTYAATDTAPQSARIKRGSTIVDAVFVVDVAFTSGGAATLDIGTWSIGKATEVVDVANGIDAAVALTAIDAVGKTVQCDGTLVNGTIPVGATCDSDVVIAPSYNTAAFTAGKGTLTIQYIEPAFTDPLAA